MVQKNVGMDDHSSLDCRQIFLNEAAVNQRVNEIIQKASTITGNNRLAWLIRALTCIDLTTLGGDDTPAIVEALCKKAVNPIKLPFEWPEPLHTAAVCVYPARIEDAANALKALGAFGTVNIASVATGFPSGQYHLKTRLEEIRCAVASGANEIDIVINRALAITHKWRELYIEIKAMREACGDAHMKAILAVGELLSLKDVYIASMIAMMAGSDFIKTSTGKETVNATLPVGVVMCRAIRDYHRMTGYKVGFKPAGGIRNSKEAIEWLTLIKEELGNEWLDKRLFRFGASGLLGNITKTVDEALVATKNLKLEEKLSKKQST